jgi:hypothetical protein
MVFVVCVLKFVFTKYGPVNMGSIFNFSDNFLPRAGLRAVSKVAPPIGTSACQLPWNRPRIIPWMDPHVLKNLQIIKNFLRRSPKSKKGSQIHLALAHC